MIHTTTGEGQTSVQWSLSVTDTTGTTYVKCPHLMRCLFFFFFAFGGCVHCSVCVTGTMGIERYFALYNYGALVL